MCRAFLLILWQSSVNCDRLSHFWMCPWQINRNKLWDIKSDEISVNFLEYRFFKMTTSDVVKIRDCLFKLTRTKAYSSFFSFYKETTLQCIKSYKVIRKIYEIIYAISQTSENKYIDAFICGYCSFLMCFFFFNFFSIGFFMVKNSLIHEMERDPTSVFSDYLIKMGDELDFQSKHLRCFFLSPLLVRRKAPSCFSSFYYCISVILLFGLLGIRSRGFAGRLSNFFKNLKKIHWSALFRPKIYANIFDNIYFRKIYLEDFFTVWKYADESFCRGHRQS